MSTKQVRDLHLKERDLRDAQIRSMHETERAQEQRIDEVSVQKFREARDNSTVHFSNAANARRDEFQK